MTFMSTLGRIAGLSSAQSTRLADLVALRRQRNKLAQLDEAALRDLGLTRSDVLAESERSFWDVPQNWRQ